MREGPTISSVIADFLDRKALARSRKTARAYRHGLQHFKQALLSRGLDPLRERARTLQETHVLGFIEDMQDSNLAPSTQKLYASAITQFYKYLAARSLAEVNLHNLDELIKQQIRRPGYRLPQFPKEAIEDIISFAQGLALQPVDDRRQQRINLRDRAFILTLADTGLRVHEACSLRRGDIDWNEGRAIIVGKGDKQAVVRFSTRALSALKDYLIARGELDGGTDRRLTALPLFARHDDGGEKKVKPISTDTGRNIIKTRVRESLGEEAVGLITPHSFRHYFVTTVLQATGGNLRVAQELARHTSITVTQRYSHLTDDELDKAYYDTFNH